MDSERAMSVQTALEWLQDCARETAAAIDETALEHRVMALFRAEDLEGLAELMRLSKLDKEFLADLGHFIARWSRRLQQGGTDL
ncbi:MAG: hypothetical protein OWU32_05160 [Firmicutes bacterium]|nr:hypothetical protein [Bacillota bacterium]